MTQVIADLAELASAVAEYEQFVSGHDFDDRHFDWQEYDEARIDYLDAVLTAAKRVLDTRE
jgi:hypothetical protein